MNICLNCKQEFIETHKGGYQQLYCSKKCKKSCNQKLYLQKHLDSIHAKSKSYRDKNKDYINNKNNEARSKLKPQVINHYSNGLNKCSCCGEKHIEFLSIDHIDGGGNIHRKSIHKSGVDFYRWLIQNKYPNGYQVLCMNCQFGTIRGKICPHQL